MSLTRPASRFLKPAIALLLGTAVLMAALIAVPPARAASLVVNSAADTVVDDGVCTLREAINAANTDTASGAAAGECAAGSGADAITFAADTTITLGSQLPAVTTEMTITGNGAANTIIQANTAADTATYRVFEVTSTGNLTLDGVTVRHGRCVGACSSFSSAGGGIWSNGRLTVTNSTLSGNSAGGDGGGGIWNNGFTLTVTNSTLSGNSALGDGGGIKTFQPTTVTNSTLSGNSAGGSGGGIANNNQTLIVTNSTLSGNWASFNGGGIWNNGTLTVTNSTLSGNTATIDGGGIYSFGPLTVTNSTLSGNSAGNGGGINSNQAALTLSRSLVSGNSANTGDELYRFSGSVSANAHNVFGYSGQDNAAAFVDFTPGASDFNATTDGTPTDLAAILDTTLADNGGPTQTHALVAGSPAIDLGPSTACSAAPIDGVDQRGYTRNVDVPGTGSDTTDLCDTGAFEFNSQQLARLTITKATDPAGGTGFPFTVDWGPYRFDFKWGSLGSAVFQFREPADIAIDAAGNVYVADLTNYRISKFDAGGTWITSWGFGPDTSDGAFNLPYSVAVGPDGSVYVADSGNHRIQKFDSAGNFLTKWGGFGTGDGQFNEPRGVAVDAEGFVYVSEYGGNRVQKFTSAGVYVTQWGTGGTADGEFDGPWGLDVTGTGATGLVVVADSGNDSVQVFELDGTFVNRFGGPGTAETQFDLPTGVAIDNAGFAVITDANNRRVTKVLLPGFFSSMWGWGVDDGSAVFQNCFAGCQAGLSGIGDGQFNFPLGLDVNAQGQVYVADSFNDRVQVFSPEQSTVLDDGQSDSLFLEPRVYLVSELVPDGWAVDDIDCGETAIQQPYGPNKAVLPLAAGEDVECTFSNRKLSRIVIVKDATPADNTPFTFEENISDPAGATFVLTDPADNTKQFIDVEPGGYFVAEDVPNGWSLEDATCVEDVDENSFRTEGDAVAINLEAGETVTCTFVNTGEETGGVCPAESPYVGNETTRILGLGLYPYQSTVAVIKDPQQVTGLYAQLAGKKLPKSTYTMARFIPRQGATNLGTVDDGVVDSAEFRDYAVFWYGESLDGYVNLQDPSQNPDRVLGRLFVTPGSATNMGRALILYPDYATRGEFFNYASVREADPAAQLAISNQNHVYWYEPANWYQTQTYEVDLGGPLAEGRPLQVQTAVVDNDPDKRPVWLTIRVVDAGGAVLVEKVFKPTGPTNGKMLNINRPVFDAPAGAAKVVITLSSPYRTGDSAALVGVVANYPCGAPVR